MKEDLKKFGLTEGEAKAYLALLKLGSSTVGPVVKESKISYSKVYEVLGRLLEKGIISYTMREKTKYFQAVEPNRLKEFLENKQKEIKDNLQILNQILPNLEKISDKKENQFAEIFVGINGLKTAYEIFLKDSKRGDTFKYFYVHEEKYSQIANDFYAKEFLFFKQKGIKLKGIASRELKKSKHYNKPPKFIQMKFVDFPLPSTIDIYKNKVLITAWREKPFVYLITSKEIAENFENYFDTLWKLAKI